MPDKKISKIYRKLMTTDSEYKAFNLVDNLDPKEAKAVLMKIVMNLTKEQSGVKI
ncbi:hypothetical protein ACQKFO_21380 [Rossellomorea sp. NPDC071047]|jgi:hypothetical protein|uniref:hypothetical protein n=1 Tax=Rossellomorea sp. NPDC071047 TaxID=3390675 RepID=UPI003D0119E0